MLLRDSCMFPLPLSYFFFLVSLSLYFSPYFSLSFFPYSFSLSFKVFIMTQNNIKKRSDLISLACIFSQVVPRLRGKVREHKWPHIRIISRRSPNVAKFFIMLRVSATWEGEEGVPEVKGNCNFSLHSKVLLCG